MYFLTCHISLPGNSQSFYDNSAAGRIWFRELSVIGSLASTTESGQLCRRGGWFIWMHCEIQVQYLRLMGGPIASLKSLRSEGLETYHTLLLEAEQVSRGVRGVIRCVSPRASVGEPRSLIPILRFRGWKSNLLKPPSAPSQGQMNLGMSHELPLPKRDGTCPQCDPRETEMILCGLVPAIIERPGSFWAVHHAAYQTRGGK